MYPSNVFRIGALAVASFWLLSHAGVAQQHAADCWLEKKSAYKASLYGKQPPLADIHAKMRTLAAQYNVPIEIIAAVCYQESNLLQYDGGFLKHNVAECAVAFDKGYISINGEGEKVQPPPGLGLMQLTSTTAKEFDGNLLISDWAFNLKAGVQVLSNKYWYAASYDKKNPRMYERDIKNQMVLENWYYALAFYNGSERYIDTIYNRIAKPPQEIAHLFTPVTITKPESVIPGFSYGKGFVATVSGDWYDANEKPYRGTVHLSASAQTLVNAQPTPESSTVPADAKPTETIALRFLMPGGSWDFREGYSVFGHSVATETKGVHAIRIPVLSASKVSLQREKGRTEAPNKLIAIPFVERHGDKEVRAYDIEQGLKSWGNKQVESIPFQIASSATYKDGFDLIPSQPLPTGVYLTGLLVYKNEGKNPTQFGYPWMFAVGRPAVGIVAASSSQPSATATSQKTGTQPAASQALQPATGVSKTGSDTFQFLVSDDSGSKSEEWKMTITPIGSTQPIATIVMDKFGTKKTKEVVLDRSQGYQITLEWEQTKQKRPDFDWSAQLSWKGADGKYGKMQPTARAFYTKECKTPLEIKTDTGAKWMLDNADGLMGTSTSGATGKTNVTTGLKALLFPLEMKDRYLRPEQTNVPQATKPSPLTSVPPNQPLVSIRRLDTEQSEVQVGHEEKKVPLLKDDVVVNKGLSIMEKIVSSLPSPTKERLKEWKFGVLSSKAIEAYGGETQGTGYVVISSESLKKFSDDAIAYMLSHEIAHCVVGHQGKVKFMEGLFAPVARLLLWFPEERLTRKQELDADKFGVTFMVKAGYKVKGAMEFLDSLSWESDISVPNSLAPTRSERRRVIEEEAKALQVWEQ